MELYPVVLNQNDHPGETSAGILEQVSDALVEPLRQLQEIAAEVRSIEPISEAAGSALTELGATAHSAAKALKAQTTAVLAPAKEFAKAVDAAFERPLSLAAEAEAEAARRLTQYRALVARERAEEEARRRLEAERLQKKLIEEAAKKQRALDEEAMKAGVSAPKVEVPTVVAPAIAPREDEKRLRSEAGTAYGKKKLVVTIVDEAAVPREYCIPSMPKLNAAAKLGVRTIPGVTIEWVEKTQFRG